MTRSKAKQHLSYAVLVLGAYAVGLARAGEEAKYQAVGEEVDGAEADDHHP
jgi:hypothetical protein